MSRKAKMESTYPAAKLKQDELYADLERTSKVMQAFPSGPMGFTPDAVKDTEEFRSANQANQRAFSALRAFNAQFVKTFKKEINAARSARGGDRASV
jgi:hypothetical protein